MMKRPNSRRNLDIAIDRLYRNIENPLQIRVVMANTIIGQLLPSGAVKGGSALKLRYGNAATRFTTDLDTVRSLSIEQYTQELTVAMQTGWNSFTGRLVIKEPANPVAVPADYIMKPYEIKLEYNGKSWLTVPIEIGHDEIGDTVDPDYYLSRDIVDIFHKLGFPEPAPVPLVPVHHQIAQKLHALSSVGSERAHDLIDLQLIFNREEINYFLVNTTCRRLFQFRKQQQWPPPVIVKGNNWDQLYTAQVGNLPVKKNIDEAIEWVNSIISKIKNASV